MGKGIAMRSTQFIRDGDILMAIELAMPGNC